jgi:hypothetical protein
VQRRGEETRGRGGVKERRGEQRKGEEKRVEKGRE